MKYLYGIIGLLVVAAAGYFYSNQNPGTEATVVDNNVRATLSPLSADVSVTSELDPEAWKVVTEERAIKDGSSVRTSPEGRALVRSDATIVTALDSNTEVVVNLTPDGKKTKVEIATGKTWSKVERALEQDEVYEVYTPTMVAAVRGTSFGVEVTKDGEKLTVTEGVVAATSSTGQFFTIETGNTLELRDDVFNLRPTTPEDQDIWYFEHNPEPEPGDMVQIDPPQLIIPIDGPSEPVACTQDVMQCPDGSFVSRVAPACAFAACPVIEEPLACTEEAKICPDGSSVVREGPQCEFAACPEIEEPEATPLTLEEVNPDTFDSALEDRLVFYGTGFENLQTVELNGNEAEFKVTKDTVFTVNTSELRDGYDTYDVTIRSETESFTLEDAFENEETDIEEELVLIIENVSEFIDSLQEESYLIVTGPGMDLVDTVLVNGDNAEFGLFSDTELHVFDFTLQSVLEITVSGAGLSDTMSF